MADRLEAHLRAAVVGGTGYTGAELTRLLLDHPHVDVAFVTSQTSAGVPLGTAVRALRNHPRSSSLRLCKVEEVEHVDVAFGCLPRGVLPAIMPLLAERAKHVVNLAGDFRLRDEAASGRHYPESSSWSEPFVYYVPDLAPDAAGRFYNLPGCMAVATLYALYPLFAERLVEPDVVVDAKTGSSGAGRRSGDNAAERWGDFRPHKLHGHRHAAEVVEALAELTGAALDLQFSTYSLDLSRGVFVSCYARLRPGCSALDVKRAFARAYRDTPFVRLRPMGARAPADLPALRAVSGSNVAEVAVAVEGTRCVAVTALDNLVKGAAGQAVQAMNRIFGLDETAGLACTGTVP